MVLKGPAYQWSLALNPNSTLQQVREAFLERFVTANNLRYKLRHNFERRCQQPGENISTYIADMQQMGTALDLDDNTIKHAIIRGLIPPIRSWVLTHEPVDLAETIRKAKVAALAVSPDADFSANALRKYDDKGIDEIIKVVKQQHEDNVAAHASLNKLTNMMADLMIQQPAPRSVRFDDSPSHNHRKDQNTHSSVNSLSELRCFFCDRPGHFMRDCRAKHRSQGRIGRHPLPPTSREVFNNRAPQRQYRKSPSREDRRMSPYFPWSTRPKSPQRSHSHQEN